MTLSKKLIFLLIGTFLIFGYTTQKATKNKLSGIFCYAANESFFIYEFFNDSSYQFRTQGNFGDSKTTGKYILNKDSIILTPYSKKRQPDSIFFFKNKDALLIINDTSLASLEKNTIIAKLSRDYAALINTLTRFDPRCMRLTSGCHNACRLKNNQQQIFNQLKFRQTVFY